MDIIFPDLPDKPRAGSGKNEPGDSKSPGKSSYRQPKGSRGKSPQVEITPSPAPQTLPTGTAQRQHYTGHVLSWQPKYRFGVEMPTPHAVYLTCWATTDEEAHYLLHAKAKREGYALGGVKNIHVGYPPGKSK